MGVGTQMLSWDACLAPTQTSTRVVDMFTVAHDVDDRIFPLVRTRESITRESGKMTWRVRCESISGKQMCAYFYFGVVSANYKRTEYKNPDVWLMCGDGSSWVADTGAQYMIVNNEMTNSSYQFKSGDVVELAFDPHTQQLTVKVDGKPGWSTTRRLEGSGIHEVHPCAVIGHNRRIVLVERIGQSKQEYDDTTRMKTCIADEQSMREAIERDAATAWRGLLDEDTTYAQRCAAAAMARRVESVLGAMTAVMQEVSSMRLAQQQLADSMAEVQGDVKQMRLEHTTFRAAVQEQLAQIKSLVAPLGRTSES